ncbi:hypothetical protein AB4138_04620 [Vibrio sp. 10N.286.52.C3]|uniref:hypothetical protein n=1 Tax=unclassified Vibrio TaxID=2614977 RepID=UPI00354FF485
MSNVKKELYIEDLKFEAALWAINKHNKYKVKGEPDSALEIYYSFGDYLDGESLDTVVVNLKDRIDFLNNMFNDARAIKFAEDHLVINDI